MKTLAPLRNLHRVYCAGPLFNAAERSEMLQISAVLSAAGYQPFVPHADGMEFAQVLPLLIGGGHDAAQAGHWLHAAIFALDTYQVCVGCGALVFNMNGRVPDEGAVAEATMAWMLGKPVVAFKEDARSAVAGRDNPLVVGPVEFQAVGQLPEIPPALDAKIAALQTSGEWLVPCAPHLAATLAAGERLWTGLQAQGAGREPAAIAELVLELFGPEAACARRAEP
jgi:nucleoside 2-deoxyribosyltransferase